MVSVLLTAASLLILILAGFLLKQAGFLHAQDHHLLSKLVMNLTLPAAVIVNFAALDLTPSLLFLAALGLGMNLFSALLAWVRGFRRKDSTGLAFDILGWSGYNIGAFTMPYLQGFLGAAGVGPACIFDVGNAVMCSGGTYALTGVLAPEEGRSHPTLPDILRRLFSSVLFDTYLVLLVLGLAGVEIPPALVTILTPAASANPCLAMLLIGLMLELKLKPGYFREALSVILARNLIAAGAAALCFFFAPLPLGLRQVLVLLLFAPMPVSALPFMEKCGCDPGLTGFAASVSILLSLPVMTLLVVGMGIG